jgi:nucleoside-diphosphate-sugar epimerase
MKTILITGAAGNLGSILANHISELPDINLHLLFHKKEVSADLLCKPNISVFKADLSETKSLLNALENTDVVIHFAGILFKHNPEKFLPVTNTVYFQNLVETAITKGIKRIILVSFPHVEGESSPKKPASGRLDGNPVSVHAQTRLEEERLLFKTAEAHHIEAASLRIGMIYGKGILMIEGARWFARHQLLGVWKKPTYIHLISTDDFLTATTQAIIGNAINGIYHLGDEGTQTLQEFLDIACTQWGYHKPWRMPVWLIKLAAWHFEFFSLLFNTKSPLTRDFIKIGMISYYGDTSKMHKDLLPVLKYKNIQEGRGTL